MNSTTMRGLIYGGLIGLLSICHAQAEGPPEPNIKNVSAVQEVLSGDRTTANAAWWGFDPADSTAALQGAIDSGAQRVVVPYMGSDWIVLPIKLASDQEIIFEPGVVVTAKKGAFRGRGDSLFSAANQTNITLRGYA